jgi:hypothetical protein
VKIEVGERRRMIAAGLREQDGSPYFCMSDLDKAEIKLQKFRPKNETRLQYIRRFERE